jgi:hypothetical protein
MQGYMLIFGSLFYTKYMNKMNLGNLVKNLRSFFFFFFFLQLLITDLAQFFFFFFFVHSVGLRQQWFGSSGFLIMGPFM